MTKRFDLGRAAREFADEMSNLLNGTVTTGIRLRTDVGRVAATVDYGSRRSGGIPLTVNAGRPSAYLDLSYRLAADDEGRYLMVLSSFVALYADAELARPLLHYDYERGKGDGYPEAHLQVVADPPAWAEVGPRGRPFERAHLSVGGRRYRPALEDVVELAVVEGIAAAHDGWRDHVAAGRAAFRRRQLRAAVRRDPVTAREGLAG